MGLSLVVLTVAIGEDAVLLVVAFVVFSAAAFVVDISIVILVVSAMSVIDSSLVQSGVQMCQSGALVVVESELK